jgi:hypothetical protein
MSTEPEKTEPTPESLVDTLRQDNETLRQKNESLVQEAVRVADKHRSELLTAAWKVQETEKAARTAEGRAVSSEKKHSDLKARVDAIATAGGIVAAAAALVALVKYVDSESQG